MRKNNKFPWTFLGTKSYSWTGNSRRTGAFSRWNESTFRVGWSQKDRNFMHTILSSKKEYELGCTRT